MALAPLAVLEKKKKNENKRFSTNGYYTNATNAWWYMIPAIPILLDALQVDVSDAKSIVSETGCVQSSFHG